MLTQEWGMHGHTLRDLADVARRYLGEPCAVHVNGTYAVFTNSPRVQVETALEYVFGENMREKCKGCPRKTWWRTWQRVTVRWEGDLALSQVSRQQALVLGNVHVVSGRHVGKRDG